MEQTFDIQDAFALLEPCGVIDKYFTVDEHGVWPAANFDKTDEVASNFARWRPALVFADDAHAPDLPPRQSAARTPALPPEFNARELAAFMMDGWGVMVADHYGEWDDGPRPDSLKEIPACEDLARLAVKCAFEARREAQKIVGAPPLELIAEADRARKAYNAASKAANIREGVSDSIPGTEESAARRERAKTSTAALDSAMEATADAARAAQEAWLNAMVRQLLQPAPALSPATPAPVPVAVVALGGEAWINKARERAAEIIKRQREKDLYPSQEHIGDEIAREFRAAGTVGTDGKPLSGAYIKRWALTGISSAQGKQLSTRTGRGK